MHAPRKPGACSVHLPSFMIFCTCLHHPFISPSCLPKILPHSCMHHNNQMIQILYVTECAAFVGACRVRFAHVGTCRLQFAYVGMCKVRFAYVGTRRVLFAYVGTCTVPFAYVGTCSVRFAYVGTCRVRFAYVGTCRVQLAYVGKCRVLVAYVGTRRSAAVGVTPSQRQLWVYHPVTRGLLIYEGRGPSLLSLVDGRR